MGRYGLLTKLEVKMAAYISFLCVFINSQKRARPIASYLDRTRSDNKGFIVPVEIGTLFTCGTRRVIPSKQNSAILPAQVANHSARFGSFCQLTELRHKKHHTL